MLLSFFFLFTTRCVGFPHGWTVSVTLYVNNCSRVLLKASFLFLWKKDYFLHSNYLKEISIFLWFYSAVGFLRWPLKRTCFRKCSHLCSTSLNNDNECLQTDIIKGCVSQENLWFLIHQSLGSIQAKHSNCHLSCCQLIF